MRDVCGAGLLHTLDTVEHPVYIPRHPRPAAFTTPRSGEPIPAPQSGDLERSIPARPRAFFGEFQPFTLSAGGAGEPILLHSTAGQSPIGLTPLPPLLGDGRQARRRGPRFRVRAADIGTNLGGPPWVAGTQEDEE